MSAGVIHNGRMTFLPASDVLIAVDKFKGSLTARELSDAIVSGMRQELGQDFNPKICPIADGGEGTVEAALAAGYEEHSCQVRGPLGETVRARFAFKADQKIAVIESAQACGMWQLQDQKLDIWRASSYGVGQLVAAALDRAAQKIIIGLGGSASSDAGAGMLQALGCHLYDSQGKELKAGAGYLNRAVSVDFSQLEPALKSVDLVAACDVTNPLYGPEGAVFVYGPQKGAKAEQLPLLDGGLKNFSQLLEAELAVKDGYYASQAGAGAAGGLGFACLALGAAIRSGVELCFDLTGFRQALAKSRVVITGEGKLDRQTLAGKGPAGVALAAHKTGAKVYAVCGLNQLTQQEWKQAGFSGIYAVVGREVSLQESLARAHQHVQQLSRRLAQDLLAR